MDMWDGKMNMVMRIKLHVCGKIENKQMGNEWNRWWKVVKGSEFNMYWKTARGGEHEW